LPVARREIEAAQAPFAHRPFVLGYAGRLEFAAKRVDRFPDLVRALQGTGVDFQLELVGEGPQAPWLRRRLAFENRIVFHGRRDGESYWQVLRQWDAIVFLSDYEGLPNALLQGFSVGVLPVFPAIGTEGDAYVARVQPSLLYAPGDMRSAAAVVRTLAVASESERQAWRAQFGALVRPHMGEGYARSFAGFVERIRSLPRVSRNRFPRPVARWSDRIPLGLLRRLRPRIFWQPRP
jgi:glycosyltransferase involved in cell wall biosynthesis